MGSLILCHKKRAKRPYEVSRIHRKLYTIEELCYYLCNNLYLLDHTIMNRRLCDWLDDELGLSGMAEELNRQLDMNVSLEEFVLTILKSAVIYAPSEIVKIQSLLEQLRNQKDAEKMKYKGDSLFQSGEYASAILVYQSLVGEERDSSLAKTFYGQVYACLGAAYGRLFLYEEAAEMYEKAYGACQEPDMLKAYLYACCRSLPEEEYVKMLSGNPLYLNMNSLLKEDIGRAKKEVNLDVEESQLALWKREYRKMDR